jgi:DNA mismatch repair ATPase MutL
MVEMESYPCRSTCLVPGNFMSDISPRTEPASHPVGTTVKVTHFFNHIPVRKQTATKNSSRCLAKIRRLMQAYALARPAVRFRLHVLKANNNKGDFVYSPKPDSNVQDAVFKAIGNDCAVQCDWAALESDGFEIHAFLPKPSATGSKIANLGAFVSVDSRPVCSTRGTMKHVTIAFKAGLRRSNPSLATTKEPFFCMNIICPPNSYDANIEPAKDDVLFEDSNVVISAVDRLLKSYYPEAVIETEAEPPTSLPLPQEHSGKDGSLSDDAPRSIHEEPPSVLDEQLEFKSRTDQPRWRANMYGIDEDDLVHFETTRALEGVEEEDEDRHAVEVSNPWTIARMNATIKPSISMCNGQLLSPAKSQGEGQMLPSSPAHQKTPSSTSPAEPLTPQLSSEADIFTSPMNEGFDHSRRSASQNNVEET